jgi:hypothetical protein
MFACWSIYAYLAKAVAVSFTFKAMHVEILLLFF